MGKSDDGSQKAAKKNVTHDLSFIEEKSLASEVRPGGALHLYADEIRKDVAFRSQIKVLETIDGNPVDMTPKPIDVHTHGEQLFQLKLTLLDEMDKMTQMYSSKIFSRTRMSQRFGVTSMNKQSMDDLIAAVNLDTITFEPQVDVSERKEESAPYNKSFVKVTLRKTPLFVLHTQPSSLVAKGTAEGDAVERDNKLYDYITVGKGKVRRRAENEAQTDGLHTTTRAVNTILITQATVGSYVSNFEMYDTVNNMLDHFSMLDSPEMGIGDSAYEESYININDETFESSLETSKTALLRIYESVAFKNAVMIMGRALSSNINASGMKRFRNMDVVDRNALNATFSYSVKLLFRCCPIPSNGERKAVSDICFCSSNGDIFAIAYGLYSFSSQHVPTLGDVYVWSIKNPGEPERAFYYKVPVTAVRFSPFIPSLLAIGMYDGSVEVRDISNPSDVPIAVSQRTSSSGYSPVVSIRWIKTTDSVNEIDPFLSLSQDGSVTRFSIIKSPFLLGFNQMTLERVEGHPEGIYVPKTSVLTLEPNRNPQGLYLTTHPLQKDIYYVLTDEGCIYKCSSNYQQQYLEVLKCHDGSVNVMEFSPWSPKLFLTAGNDWYVRIWIEGITRPLIELKNEFTPIHWANWSYTHSTIIVSLCRKSISIWDLRRNILQPMAVHAMDSSFNTIAQFSNCGRTIVVGNERGNTLFEALGDMPFPPHFQYDELEKTIFKAVGNDHELLTELKSIGFFGHEKKGFLRPNYCEAEAKSK